MSPDDPIFGRLIADIGEMPEVITRAQSSSDYLFDDTGLTLHYMNGSNCFVQAFFHWASADARAGRVKRYAGRLFAGIEFGETVEQIEKKLGLKPARSRATTGEVHNEYEVGALELHCKFDAAERLEHFSVWFTPACTWRKAP